jgi:hypothetical protein
LASGVHHLLLVRPMVMMMMVGDGDDEYVETQYGETQ